MTLDPPLTLKVEFLDYIKISISIWPWTPAYTLKEVPYLDMKTQKTDTFDKCKKHMYWHLKVT